MNGEGNTAPATEACGGCSKVSRHPGEGYTCAIHPTAETAQTTITYDPTCGSSGVDAVGRCERCGLFPEGDYMCSNGARPVPVPELRNTAAAARGQDGDPLRDDDKRAALPGQLAEERRVISFEVLGTPAPKGSSRAFYKAGMKRAVIVKDNSEKQKGWDGAVREAAALACTRDRIKQGVAYLMDAPTFVDVAIDVTIVFHVKRPKGHFGKGKRAGQLLPSAPSRPKSKPDVDKLARCTLDAITGSIFVDDGQVADLSLSKRWAAPGREGATITICEALP